MRVLLVEDDPLLRSQLKTTLDQVGYAVDEATDGQEALHLGSTESYDAIVLDLGLPVLDGLTVLQRWRSHGQTTPVLILTARDSWHEKVAGIDAGADDYLTKPFHTEELLARLRALQRRRAPASESMEIVLGCLHMDLMTRKVTCGGIALDLTPREYGLLAILARKAGEVVPREQLAREVWQSPKRFTPLDNLIEVNISRLRNKLAEAHCILRLHTVRGMGYQLEKPS